jgi:serine phosphatase RsbU (regulator of sigma subunit)
MSRSAELTEALPAGAALGEKAPRIPWYRGLTFKQVAMTLMLTIVLGFVSSAYQLYDEWKKMIVEVEDRIALTLELVRPVAIEAVKQDNLGFQQGFVEGLFRDPMIQLVMLKDPNGDTLVARSRKRDARFELSRRYGHTLFGTNNARTVDLYKINRDGEREGDSIGKVIINLAPDVIADRFFEKVFFELEVTLFREFAYALAIAMLLHYLLTRPLVSVGNALLRVDPERPGSTWQPPDLKFHRRDELGQVVTTMNQLTSSLQTSLERQARFASELQVLNAELEQRVADRTSELQVALAQVGTEKAAAERALADLDYAHGELSKAIGLVMDSINYAKRIQQALLPTEQDLVEAAPELAVWWEPLHVVGGDFYVVQKFGNKTLIMLADCTGHGVPGAFLTLVVANALDQLLRTQQALQMEAATTPDELLALLDEQVRQRLHRGTADASTDDGLDAAIALWDPDSGKLSFAAAGLQLLVVEDGAHQIIRGDRGGIGYAHQETYRVFRNHVVDVRPGMTFFMFTDGITDHMGGDPPRLFGKRRLANLLTANASLPAAGIINVLKHELERYRGENPRRDDCAFVCFRLG